MATHGAYTRDPRSIITPDAFEVSDALLGLPLATPWTRLWALSIDLAVIGAVTLLTKSFALVLGIVAAFFFIRAGLKRTPVKNSAFGRAMRLSVGCLGLWIGIITILIWVSLGSSGGGRDRSARDTDGGDGDRTASVEITSTGDLMSVLRAVSDAREFRNAPDAATAREAARNVARRAEALGLPDNDVRGMLLEAVPERASWAGDAALIVDEALAGDDDPTPTADPEDEAVSTLGTADALERYAELVRAGDDVSEADATRRTELRRRLAVEVAADTLRTLEEHLADIESVAENRSERIDDLQGALRDERGGASFFGWIRQFVDELGFGFGWASLYLTVMLSWWRGQTVGKRAMGIRVVRLDGEPITWWTAFERAGGYAAGFATGLLGFAQVFWDANRQAIHDRIVGTVVVVDGAAKVVDWEESL